MITYPEFLAAKCASGVSVVDLGPAQLHLQLNQKASDTLIVFFTAAVDRRNATMPPFFSGQSVGAGLDASVLSISDPALTMSEELGLGWYAGARDLPLQDILVEVIQKVSSDTGATKVILTGGSGGGFAAMYYAARLPGSVFFAVNPQSGILRFYRAHIERYARACFGWQDGEQFSDALDCIDHDLVPLYRNGPATSGIYLQNASDAHVQSNALPFLTGIGGRDEAVDQQRHGVHFVLREWGDGHAALPPQVYQAFLRHLMLKDVSDVAGMADILISGGEG